MLNGPTTFTDPFGLQNFKAYVPPSTDPFANAGWTSLTQILSYGWIPWDNSVSLPGNEQATSVVGLAYWGVTGITFLGSIAGTQFEVGTFSGGDNGGAGSTQSQSPLKTAFFIPLPPGANVNYCGPGANGGNPTSGVDAACQQHDQCYSDAYLSGLGGYVGVGLSASQSQAKTTCDQALCNALDQNSHSHPIAGEEGYQDAGVRLAYGCSVH